MKTQISGWWQAKGRKRIPVTPSHEAGKGIYLCDEAVRLVAEWVGNLGWHTSEWQQLRPTRVAVDALLADNDDPPAWADSEVMAGAEATRTALETLYESAWGRPPSVEECWALTAAAARTKDCRWLL